MGISKKYIYPFVVIILILLIASFFLAQRFRVVTVHPKRGPIVEAVYGIGTVTATHTYTLKIGVIQTLEEVLVKEGDIIKKGVPLVRLDTGTIRSPIDGTVTSMPFNVGENVFPQTPIVTVSDLNDRYLVVSLEQQGAIRVKRGQKAQISFDSLRGQKFDGVVRSIFPVNDQFLVHVNIQNLPPEILPGMTADVAIEINRKENVLLIPARALAHGRVIVANGSRRNKIDLQIGNVDGEWAEVLSNNLTESDQIVVSH